MILLTAAPLPFNAMLVFAIILGVGSLMISVSDTIKTRKRKRRVRSTLTSTQL